MKLTKKFLLVALAAFAFVFASCEQLNPTLGGDPNAEDSVSGTIINGVTSKAYVGAKDGDGYKNEGNTGTVREMQFFATKHYGAFAALTLQGEDKDATEGNGQLGYVFNKTENEDKTVNFITIGFRWNNKKLDTYVSQFYNVKTDQFSESNFGVSAKKTAFDKDTTTPYEIEIKVLPTVLDATKFGTLDADGSATVGVEVIAEDDGSYTINYYASSKLDDKFKLKKDQTADMTVEVPATVTGYTKKQQTKIGCYAAVYKNKTLNGFWRFSSIVGEGEVEEF